MPNIDICIDTAYRLFCQLVCVLRYFPKAKNNINVIYEATALLYPIVDTIPYASEFALYIKFKNGLNVSKYNSSIPNITIKIDDISAVFISMFFLFGVVIMFLVCI